MIIEKNWKYYLGITLFIYSFVPYLTVELITLLPLSIAAKITVAASFIGSAEISFFASVALLGKPFIELLKTKFKAYFLSKKPAAAPPRISKLRHYTGITLLVLSFLPYYASIVYLLFGHPDIRGVNFIVGFMLAGEALFIISLFILGGEFWERLKKLFEWPGKKTGDAPESI